MHDSYFQIGEFAALCGVKKATLVHYAKIGLLLPDHVGENGYYYYSPGQVFDFEAIAVLRSMGISLAEVKSYMRDRNTENCREVLQKNLEKLREQKRHLEYVETIVQNTLYELEKAKGEKLDQIELVTFERPERYYIYEMSYRTENYVFHQSKVHEMIDCCRESLSNKSISVIEVVLHKDVQNGSFAKSFGGFKAQEDAVISPEHTMYRPAGTYLTVCCKSGGDKIVDVYRTLKKYADENGYRVIGNAYEEDVLNYIVEHNREDYLVRCYLQVEAAGPKSQKGSDTMERQEKTERYPYRAPKKFTERSLHGRVRTAYLLYSDLRRAQKFYINVFGWDMFKLPQNVLGRRPDPATPDVICASGPAQFGWEGAEPGYMPVELIHRDAENDKPFVMMEVSMDVPLQSTVDKIIAAGGKLIKMGGDAEGDWADVATVEDPAGNRLLLWKCPDSRTWEEPETDYDKD